MFRKDLCEGDFDEAVKRADGLCVIPVGCFEMHGKHLPAGTDVYEAEAVAAESKSAPSTPSTDEKRQFLPLFPFFAESDARHRAVFYKNM